jgi:hypothetical protein
LCVISAIVAINFLVESGESTLLLPRAENKTRDNMLPYIISALSIKWYRGSIILTISAMKKLDESLIWSKLLEIMEYVGISRL